MESIQDFLNHFHFLRPLWLLALLPVAGLGTLLWRQKRRASQWQQVIQPDLLGHLLEGSLGKASRWQLAGLITGWVIACIALAGPTWQRLPQPVHQSDAAVVILLDMSPSMVAEDIKPSRLQRARFKLRDYLSARADGLTALVVYAGEAHVVSPLTDDTETIANLLPALHPNIMPLPGSNVEMAVDKALNLLATAGANQGEILLVTDGVASEALPALREKLTKSNSHLSVLGVGTAEGAPIPTGDGGFARTQGNEIIIAKLNDRQLQQLSHNVDGTYAALTADDSDIQHLLTHTERQAKLDQHQRIVERNFDIWQDKGQWLAVLLLPFAALAFRRGWLLSITLVGTLGFGLALSNNTQANSTQANNNQANNNQADNTQANNTQADNTQDNNTHAFEWRDLWLRGDQQGLIELEQGNPNAAAKQFQSHDWRGTAHYRDQNYPAAAQAFSKGNTATDHYNRGNALAKAGKLQEALDAYQEALSQQPNFADAKFNADVVQRLLEQQQQSNQQQQSDQQQQSNQQQQSDQQQQSAQQNQSSQRQQSTQAQQPNQDQQSNQQQAGQQQNQTEQNPQSQQQNAQQDQQQNQQQQARSDTSSTEQQNEHQSQNTQATNSQSQPVDEKAAQALADRQPDPQTPAEQQQEELQNQTQQPEQQTQTEQQDQLAATQAQQTAAPQSDPTKNTEQQQALEQWLRQVPDDPSGLLRRKFEYEHRKMRQQYRTGDWLPPENQAYERW